MRRQLIPAERLAVGDRILDDASGELVVVARVTGSPGRKSDTRARLLRVFLAGITDPVTLRADSPVAIEPRRTVRAGQLRPGDVARLDGRVGYRTVVRVTGSPGRRSPGLAPLIRVFVEGIDGYTTVRNDISVPVPPKARMVEDRRGRS